MSILINYLSVLFLKLKAILVLSILIILLISFTVINSSVVALVRVLNDNESELLVWRNHNLMLQGANTDESDGLLLMDLLDFGLGAIEEAADDLTVFNGGSGAHGGPNGEALVVDDNDSNNAHVGVNAIHSLFNFRRHHNTLNYTQI